MNKISLFIIIGVVFLGVGGGVLYFQSDTLKGPPEPTGGTFPDTESSSGNRPSSGGTGESTTGGQGSGSATEPTTGSTGGSPTTTKPPPPSGTTGANPPPSGTTGSTGSQTTTQKQVQEMDAAATQYGSMNSSVQGLDDSTSL